MVHTIEISNSLQAIESIDLSSVKIKLQSHIGWSSEKCESAEFWYKRFLTLGVKYTDKVLVPSREIDEIWHMHILDTKKYANDCKIIFGYFFHHSPTYGQRNLSKEFEETKALCRAEFGEDFGYIVDYNPQSCSGNDCGGS